MTTKLLLTTETKATKQHHMVKGVRLKGAESFNPTRIAKRTRLYSVQLGPGCHYGTGNLPTANPSHP